jgi:hypothetical protein
MFIQMCLIKDADHTDSISFSINWRQVKQSVELAQNEGEREREMQIKGVRDRA